MVLIYKWGYYCEYMESYTCVYKGHSLHRESEIVCNDYTPDHHSLAMRCTHTEDTPALLGTAAVSWSYTTQCQRLVCNSREWQ